MMRRCFIHKLKRCFPFALVIIIGLLFSVPAFAAGSQKWNLGNAEKTGLDNGYTNGKTIGKDDPHYGWNLGQFYVSGYTQRTTDSQNNDVFLKNVGDQVELHFELLQDIDCLHGEKNLTINADRNGYDKYFGTQQFNDCRGLLIIRKTDYQNKTYDPVVYTNYLDGVKQGADTVVEFCEEGDYEVALDYEIKEEHYGANWNTYVSVPTYTDYRIFFTFKIRNGNCMVFPFDTVTGSELTNESFTDNGFYLDLANSRYLDINVQRAVYVEGANGYTEDIRFNRPAADGTQYKDEGVYTITVTNNYTKQSTTKVIYVGTDPIMKAYAASDYSLDEIQGMIDVGYTISDRGVLIAPTDSDETVDTIPDVSSADDVVKETIIPNETGEEDTKEDTTKTGILNSNRIVLVVIAAVVLLGIIVLLVSIKRRGKSKKSA